MNKETGDTQMNEKINYYVISYDYGSNKPFGFAWFSEIGVPGESAFTYYDTLKEAKAQATKPNSVCLDKED